MRFGYGELLKDRSSLSAYCQNNPDGVIEGNYTKEYGFRVDTDEHSYILRCNPTKGDYHSSNEKYREMLKHRANIQTILGQTVSAKNSTKEQEQSH